jgi:hypothetical protein
MIIRKPYAFLIKNFKKIHIFLFVLCAFIFYETTRLSGFVNEFINYGTYNIDIEPVTNYVNFFAIISIIVAIALTIVLLLLLRHKNKPWKLYGFIVLEYIMLFICYVAIFGYFTNYANGLDKVTIRVISNLLLIASLGEYPVFVILFIRIFGIDLNKFNFETDQEYLELEDKDREEIEINIDIDKESFKRGWNRFLRNANYFYQEHKFICNTIATILIIFVAYQSYNFIFITHRAYKQGSSADINGYTITVNNSYYTNRSDYGKVISNANNFVIIDLTIKNNYQMRTVNLGRYHVMNGTSNSSPTGKTFNNYFNDYGTTYASDLTLKNGGSQRLILIYKVPTNLNYSGFVLYYQEIMDNGSLYLRKIKLKMQDLSTIVTHKTKNLGEKLTIYSDNKNKNIYFTSASLVDSLSYNTDAICDNSDCGLTTATINAPNNKKILQISFASEDFEGKDLIDFSTEYGKISYIDSKSVKHTISIENAITETYYGKYLYLKVPSEMQSAKQIYLIYTIRNNKYVYQIR